MTSRTKIKTRTTFSHLRLRLDFRSTAYSRSLRSQWRNTGRWPASRSHADLCNLGLKCSNEGSRMVAVRSNISCNRHLLGHLFTHYLHLWRWMNFKVSPVVGLPPVDWSPPDQWCGLRPSVLGQDRSETKKRSWSCTLRYWSWSCRYGVVLWNTVLSRSSS